MSPDFVVSFGREAILITLMLALPMLGLGLIVGLIISIFQAVTSIQEMTLTFIPKIVAIMFALIIFAPWMLEKMILFTRTLIINIPTYVR
ncbi:MAG: flagellar biosynthesis protein FliQ [Deltaproteobacteria bacterium]|nr:flagellar biosynthesis protein FliQ [Deltaproteobacteria bacterium]MBW2050832.1 flagellar biosynthesis protein FliQ [Deltaproteobacteria bacterium]MBW2140056.1 flagellar biosynthesis protein FliQ [Deltaproteobacteria bacterium]MBW2322078.1 flagellar biosynthesis protein FliQ [Deltaproteobacteria bacterium]